MISSDEIEKNLDAASERLYEMFSSYKLRPRIEGCPCCVSKQQEHHFHVRSLRQLTAEDLSTYAFKAMTTWGDEYDFKHFLPRIFELCARDQEFGVDLEVVFGKLTYAGWSSWRLNERQAIEQYLQTVWNKVLNSERHWDQTVDSSLCGIGSAVDDMEPYLKLWQQNISFVPIQHLTDFLWLNWGALINKRALSNPFWELCTPQMQQVIDWLLHDETISAFSNALDSSTADDLFNELASLVYNGLQPLRAAHLSK